MFTRVEADKGGGDGVNNTLSCLISSGAATNGNLVIVVIRNSNSGSASDGDSNFVTSVMDSQDNTYSLIAHDTTQDPAMWMYAAIVTNGAINVTVTANFNGDGHSFYSWIEAVSYSVTALTAALDTSDHQTGAGGLGVTDLTTHAFSTAQPAELVVVGVGQNAFATYTAGTDFTIVDGSIPHNTNDFGGVEEFITSSALSSYTAHITSTVANQYTMVMGAFKEPSGGGIAPLGAFHVGLVPKAWY